MLKKEAISFIEEVPWVYAKSYAAFLPHYYTTRDRVQDDERFELFILVSYLRYADIFS